MLYDRLHSLIQIGGNNKIDKRLASDIEDNKQGKKGGTGLILTKKSSFLRKLLYIKVYLDSYAKEFTCFATLDFKLAALFL